MSESVDKTSRRRTPVPQIAVLSTVSLIRRVDDDCSLEEMIFMSSREALASANLSFEALDGVVMSGNDQVNGRVISCMVASGPAAGFGKDVTMVASSADHALIYGYMRLLSDQGRNVLVIGWSKSTESVDPTHAQTVSSEPFFLRQVGMNDTIASGLQASRLGKSPRSDSKEFRAWPLTSEDLPQEGDVVFATLLAVEGSFVEGRELGWIAGVGWATGTPDLGGRDLGDFSMVVDVAKQVFDRGGPPTSEWSTVEIAAPSEDAVQAVASALSLGRYARINPSGPLSRRPTSAHVAGLGRMMSAVDGLPGRTEATQYAIGIGTQGFAAQGFALVAFCNRKAES
ncbi:MAG: hypothetical protein JW395_1504 [Nitrospira sp.]|nr:hypothetical protein [Nitrospira sp.]